ncbi:MAG: Glycosyltransferase involved in cell wall biogenesis [Candidatus Kaiserbacteria bacterium GW2011_GWB1_52_6]|uniref:Glycosyltransferase involved in cell wall biogenesis n=3 Tax=Candidatus Kaiseribacteriota TaxID=1752734 RepID=A0A0G1XL75_9BACT|nr:MAG: Glycosyltransferase involved in cell wall biogenesis [Candidatus Kaiserbacteria bacterium GW2011_GWA2_52_12]KKW27346.1 MAG: Glycosyltransferase involved in cell wall biogenesis [Candidatus Kaiserbacteria bacterium GW2011_GWB1_52_6]KKW31600.1 MAG: Glycosyltransferase involved in cell wall biogenesis [Candidatus Kaiserbacteria bacterium GW2011_GWC2_52_8b]
MVQTAYMGDISMSIGIVYALIFLCLYFEIFLLVSFLERKFGRRGAKERAGITHFPHVAIIVPCFNEEKTIGATMRSLLALEYPREKLDIIVVDDGSTDRTFEIASQYINERDTAHGIANVRAQQRTDVPTNPKCSEDVAIDLNASEFRNTMCGVSRVRIFHKENGGKHTAMNLGLEKIDAELIGCLDADSIVEKYALQEMVSIFKNPKVAAVTPGIHVKNPETILQHMQNVEYRLSVFNRFIFAALGSVFITPGPFSIFRTSIVRRLGGWRYAHSTEDMEMALRIQAAGLLIANAPRAVVHTSTPRTLRALYRQRVRWTYGWICNAKDYRYMFGNRAFGNLGIIILPWAIFSIATGIYFFFRVMWYGILYAQGELMRIQIMGVHPQLSYDPFYINTSALFMLVVASVAVILVLICIGSFIGTGSKKPPMATPLFLFFYSFLAPVWLLAAVFRAMFKTGVQWR